MAKKKFYTKVIFYGLFLFKILNRLSFNIFQSEIFEYKKQLVETDSRVRTIQNLFDSIRTERNNLQKTLQETQNDVTELKSKLKMSVHQCEQLKEDITSKEEQLIKVDNSLRKANKIIETLKYETKFPRVMSA